MYENLKWVKSKKWLKSETRKYMLIADATTIHSKKNKVVCFQTIGCQSFFTGKYAMNENTVHHKIHLRTNLFII